MFRVLGFRASGFGGLALRSQGLGFRVWGLGFGFGVWVLFGGLGQVRVWV